MSTEVSEDVESLVQEWLTLAEAAERLDITVPRVKQLLRDRELLAVRRGERDAPHVPAAFIVELDGSPAVVRGLGGTLTVLEDAGYTDAESARWLFTADDALGGSPVEALRNNKIKAVRRIAQTLGF